MKKVFKYRKKLRIEQGKFYHFKLHKRSLSPEGLDYFVMVDPLGDKHLVPVEYYSSYKLKVGNSYLCKVDKINCLGHIFIEPPHPFYQENKNYRFTYLRNVQMKHKSGNVFNYYLFQGENKYSAFMSADNNELSENVKSGFQFFLVKKISKGVVYIEISNKGY